MLKHKRSIQSAMRDGLQDELRDGKIFTSIPPLALLPFCEDDVPLTITCKKIRDHFVAFVPCRFHETISLSTRKCVQTLEIQGACFLKLYEQYTHWSKLYSLHIHDAQYDHDFRDFTQLRVLRLDFKPHFREYLESSSKIFNIELLPPNLTNLSFEKLPNFNPSSNEKITWPSSLTHLTVHGVAYPRFHGDWLPPNLTSLTTSDVRNLVQMKEPLKYLNTLICTQCYINSADLSEIAKLPCLTNLTINEIHCTGPDILSTIPSLQHLTWQTYRYHLPLRLPSNLLSLDITTHSDVQQSALPSSLTQLRWNNKVIF